MHMLMAKLAVLNDLDRPVILVIQIQSLFAFCSTKCQLLSSKNLTFEVSDVTVASDYA